MEQQYLIDSNCIIYYLGNQLPSSGAAFMSKILDNYPTISVITKIEVLGFNAADKDIILLSAFMNDVLIIGLTSDIVTQTIAIRKSHKIKIPDAIIAATALVNSMTLITRNTDDFRMIGQLQMVNPFLL